MSAFDLMTPEQTAESRRLYKALAAVVEGATMMTSTHAMVKLLASCIVMADPAYQADIHSEVQSYLDECVVQKHKSIGFTDWIERLKRKGGVHK